jgi:hypothetical protein
LLCFALHAGFETVELFRKNSASVAPNAPRNVNLQNKWLWEKETETHCPLTVTIYHATNNFMCHHSTLFHPLLSLTLEQVEFTNTTNSSTSSSIAAYLFPSSLRYGKSKKKEEKTPRKLPPTPSPAFSSHSSATHAIIERSS